MMAIVAFCGPAAIVAIRAPRTMAASQSLVGCSDGTREGAFWILQPTLISLDALVAGAFPASWDSTPGAAPGNCPSITTFDTIDPACGTLKLVTIATIPMALDAMLPIFAPRAGTYAIVPQM